MTQIAYSVILVHSSSYAIRAEKLLKKAGIECKMMPVPRDLSSDCGVCVRITSAEREQALCVLEAARLTVVGVHGFD
jgi:uncharacterized SAM-binding protein YcdF (DUF218 family)